MGQENQREQQNRNGASPETTHALEMWKGIEGDEGEANGTRGETRLGWMKPLKTCQTTYQHSPTTWDFGHLGFWTWEKIRWGCYQLVVCLQSIWQLCPFTWKQLVVVNSAMALPRKGGGPLGCERERERESEREREILCGYQGRQKHSSGLYEVRFGRLAARAINCEWDKTSSGPVLPSWVDIEIFANPL